MICPDDIFEEFAGRRSNANFLAKGIRCLRTIIVQLVQTNIGPVKPVTIADFGIIPTAKAGDRRQAMFAQFDVSLQRDAPAFFLCRGNKVLPNVA